jgi:hypothetical protein
MEGGSTEGGETGWDSNTIVSQPNHGMTATPSTLSRPLLPQSGSVANSFLDIYQECIENGDWVRVVFGVLCRIERLPLTCKTIPATSVPALLCRQGWQQRHARDRSQRQAWIERRRSCSMPGPPQASSYCGSRDRDRLPKLTLWSPPPPTVSWQLTSLPTSMIGHATSQHHGH